ncbi:MAG: hypothetical protein NUW08_00740 [Candidatus Uhrbacteria bacterium]|nr:hypothetical protein [Candidatus Uhrbacteria bacterium]
MNQLLAALGDGAVPAILLYLIFRFWPQFQSLVGLLHDAGDWTAARVEIFVNRTSVIMLRPIWRVLLPVMGIAAIASTASVCFGLTNAWAVVWLIVGTLIKAAAFGWAASMTRLVHRVQHIDQNDTRLNPPAGQPPPTRVQVEEWYGRPGLLTPMLSTAFWSLAIVTAAMLVDTFVLADNVIYFHSVFQAVLFIGMLAFTLCFLVGMLLALYAFVAAGIELGGGGWSGLFVPIATAIIPILTRNNNQVIMITDDARRRARETAWKTLVDNRFAGGVAVIWGLWFLNFHSPLAWLIELVVTMALIFILLGYVWITRKVILRVAEVITLIVLVAGGVMLAWRLIDAAIPGPHPVMFYERFPSLFGWDLPDMSLGCFIAGVPRASLLLVGLIAVVLGWLATRTDGKRSRILFLVAALIGLPIVGIVTARAMTPDGYLCATQTVAETPTDPSVDDGASPPESASSMHSTVIAGSYEPQSVVCTRRRDGSSVPRCP